MNKSTWMVSLLIGAALSTSAFAVGNTYIINNTSKSISFGASYCNKVTKLCTYVHTYKVGTNSSGKNTITLMAPLNTETLMIDSTTAIDSHGSVVSKSAGECHVPDSATTVLFDDFGTKHIICQYGEIA